MGGPNWLLAAIIQPGYRVSIFKSNIMKNYLFAVLNLLIVFPMACQAANYSERDFKRCVDVKDTTLKIAQQAEKGVTRREMLSRVGNDEAFMGIINLVYDFSGAMSSQEIARRQFESCLQYITKRK